MRGEANRRFPTELVVAAAGGNSLDGRVRFPASQRFYLDRYAALNTKSGASQVGDR